MKKNPPVKSMKVALDSDFEAVIICAVRYACGRYTYMPGLVQDWIMGHCAGKLSQNALCIMARDIEEQISASKTRGVNHGSSALFEHDLMYKLHDWCKAEIMGRGSNDEA